MRSHSKGMKHMVVLLKTERHTAGSWFIKELTVPPINSKTVQPVPTITPETNLGSLSITSQE